MSRRIPHAGEGGSFNDGGSFNAGGPAPGAPNPECGTRQELFASKSETRDPFPVSHVPRQSSPRHPSLFWSDLVGFTLIRPDFGGASGADHRPSSRAMPSRPQAVSPGIQYLETSIYSLAPLPSTRLVRLGLEWLGSSHSSPAPRALAHIKRHFVAMSKNNLQLATCNHSITPPPYDPLRRASKIQLFSNRARPT